MGQKQNPLIEETYEEKYSIDPFYFYEMLDLRIESKIAANEMGLGGKIQNKLYKVSSHKISFQYEPSYQIVLAQASFSKPAIKERVFEGNEATVELYNLIKSSISISMANLTELFYFDKLQKKICYFQPRYIL